MQQSIRHLRSRSAAVSVIALACLASPARGLQVLADVDQQAEDTDRSSSNDSQTLYLGTSRVQASMGALESALTTLFASLEYSTFSATMQSTGMLAAELSADAHGRSLLGNPVAGSGRWTGRVVGVDASSGAARGNRILGDAEIVLEDFANPALDLRFSQLYDIETGIRRTDMQWSDVPVSGGAFAASDSTSALSGRFYGPHHEEVAGTFERDLILGAFGAAREDVGTGAAPSAGFPTEPSREMPDNDTEGLASTRLHFDIGAIFRGGIPGTSRVHNRFSGRGESAAFAGQTDIYVKWLERGHGFAFRNAVRFGETLAALADADLSTPFDSSVAYSGGLAASLTPSAGSASWIGSMVGMDPADPTLEMRGDARVSIADFTDPAAFIELTNIRELGTNESRPNIYWNRVPIVRGSFQGRTAGGWVDGSFHGENQEEVAGIFYRPSLTGTFGAYRVDSADASASSAGSQVFNTVGYITGTDLAPGAFGAADTGAVQESGAEAAAFEAAQWAYFVAAAGSAGPAVALVAGSDGRTFPGLGAFGRNVSDATSHLADRTSDSSAGELPHGAFGAVRYDLAGVGGAALSYSAGFAFGLAADSNPTSGSASWSGDVFGVDVSDGETAGNSVAGAVAITIPDFAAPVVNVSFTGLRDLALDAARADMAWESIPLDAGNFRAKLEDSVIDGHLYGDDHSHVGGVFERDGIIGGFGGQRTPEP